MSGLTDQRVWVNRHGDVFSSRHDARVDSNEDYVEVKIVPADAIVIERSELPAVDVWLKGEKREDYRTPTAHIERIDVTPDTADYFRIQARDLLALAEYLTANPPVDAAQVEAIANLILEDASIIDVDGAAAIAQRLVVAGVRVVTS